MVDIELISRKLSRLQGYVDWFLRWQVQVRPRPGETLLSTEGKIQLKEYTMTTKPFFIRAEWDDESQVWVATSDDVPGLATEGETLEQLIQKLKIMIPELLEANGVAVSQEVPFELLSRRFEIARQAVG